MSEVRFHFNVTDSTGYACRLLRKATHHGATVVVTGAAPVLANLDRALWAFEAVEFLPHVLLRSGQSVPDHLRATKVWLSEDAGASGHHDVLVNLGLTSVEAPTGFERFARLIEIVSTDAAERAAARLRWKHYASLGHAVQGHEAAS